jgi:hypothetical protein
VHFHPIRANGGSCPGESDPQHSPTMMQLRFGTATRTWLDVQETPRSSHRIDGTAGPIALTTPRRRPHATSYTTRGCAHARRAASRGGVRRLREQSPGVDSHRQPRHLRGTRSVRTVATRRCHAGKRDRGERDLASGSCRARFARQFPLVLPVRVMYTNLARRAISSGAVLQAQETP